MMERETRVAFGDVPRNLFGQLLAETSWQMQGSEFLLRGEGDHYFHYRQGEGITIERGVNSDLSEESLWLNGSVYAAVASINGLLPLHASAVAHNGRVVAFTGPAGAGKSTLVAALGGHGLPMFCDDTLLLDVSNPHHIDCLPGHKRLKLRPDAVDLTGAQPEEAVSTTVDKAYASPSAGNVGIVMPLAMPVFLEVGPEPGFEPIFGSDRFVRARDDHHTTLLFECARQFDRAAAFEHRQRLARQINMVRFVRPIDRSRFAETVALAAEYVTNATRGS